MLFAAIAIRNTVRRVTLPAKGRSPDASFDAFFVPGARTHYSPEDKSFETIAT
jgi:hypothetical protein